MLKCWNFISSKSENIVKENIESLVILHLLKWIFQNQLIIQQTFVEMAKVLLHYISVASIFHNTIIFKFKVKENTYDLQCGGKLGKPK